VIAPQRDRMIGKEGKTVIALLLGDRTTRRKQK